MDGFESLNFIFAHEFKSAPSRCRSPLYGGSSSSRRHGSCSGRRSATGSPRSVATPPAPRAVGVPVTRVKIGLFMTVSFLLLVHRHALPVSIRRSAGWQRRGQRVPLHHRRGCGRDLADRRLRQCLGVAIGAFIFGMTSLCIVYAGWEPELVQGLPRRHAAACGDGQPVREETLNYPKGGLP